MRVLVVGCGYLGTRLAQRWHGRGAAVQAVMRSTDTAAALQRLHKRVAHRLKVLGDAARKAEHRARAELQRRDRFAFGHEMLARPRAAEPVAADEPLVAALRAVRL